LNRSIAVVEPNPIFREGLVRIIVDAGFKQCLGFGSPDDIRDDSVPVSDRWLFLIDQGEDHSALARTIEDLRVRYPSSEIVVFAERYSVREFIGAMRAGARGYLLKFISCDALTRALNLAVLGQSVIPAQAVELLCSNSLLADQALGDSVPLGGKLSSREIQVLKGLTLGSPNKVIARQFGITEATVKVHIKAILRKIQLKNRTEAAIWARSQGLNAPALPHN
jgi:two-component system nitrate/nitrite response regulator NarL